MGQRVAQRGGEGGLGKLLPAPGFVVVLARRWVVERTFSWVEQNRMMSKDYERPTETSEAFTT